MTKKKTTPRGRDSRTGEFIPIGVARRRKATATVDQIPVNGGKSKRSR
jgi:hypothetical protein